MNDEYGRTNNRAQVIRNLDKVQMAWLLHDLQEHPEKYPDTVTEWFKWLDSDSGNSLEKL